MSKYLQLKQITAYLMLPLFVAGCSPLIPENYLSPGSMRTVQKVNGEWIKPRLIVINAETFQSSEGQELLKTIMQPQQYHIGAFDSLDVIVWGHPEISTMPTVSSPQMMTTTSSISTLGSLGSTSSITMPNSAIQVQSDGTIFYPYVGHLNVSGMTLNEIQTVINQRLAKYIRNPQVTVQVSRYRNRNAYVLGEVRAPGMVPLTDKPLTLLQAISAAGGINPATADPTHIYVVRGSYTHPDVYCLNARSAQNLLIAERFPLQENDILYVSGATLNSWNSFISTVLPTFSTYYAIKGLAS